MASMQVRRLRRSPGAALGPGDGSGGGSREQPSSGRVRARREERLGGRNRPGRSRGRRGPGWRGRGGQVAAGKGRDGGETRRGVRGEAGTRTAAGGAGAGEEAPQGGVWLRCRRFLGRRGKGEGIPVPGTWGAAAPLGAMAMCVTPCGVRGQRDPPRAIAGAVTRAPGSWGSGAVIPPHKGDWGRHVLLQAACSPWGFLSLRKMRLRCGVSSVDR